MPAIARALVPAAGYGTRLRPLTLAIPKEMLPLGRKPVLEIIVEELAASGIREILMVVSPGKESIRSYFEDGTRFGARITYAVQSEMRGLGDAILHGEEWANGQPFLTAFGDCIIDSPNHFATRRLLDAHRINASFATVLAQKVPRELVSRYGILSQDSDQSRPEGAFPFSRIVEKPRPEDAPSQWAVAARWALGSDIFQFLRGADPDPKGEIGLSQAVDRALLAGQTAWAVPLNAGERRIDIGSWDSYLYSAAEAILQDPELGEGIRRRICVEADADARGDN